MPKLIVFAARRWSAVTSSGAMPKTVAAVARWMSSPRGEGVDQRLLVGDVRQDAQLDLAVVGDQQHVPRAAR